MADTQHLPPYRDAIVCRNCDQVDLRYGDLIPAITVTQQPIAATRVRTPGATS